VNVSTVAFYQDMAVLLGAAESPTAKGCRMGITRTVSPARSTSFA